LARVIIDSNHFSALAGGLVSRWGWAMSWRAARLWPLARSQLARSIRRPGIAVRGAEGGEAAGGVGGAGLECDPGRVERLALRRDQRQLAPRGLGVAVAEQRVHPRIMVGAGQPAAELAEDPRLVRLRQQAAGPGLAGRLERLVAAARRLQGEGVAGMAGGGQRRKALKKPITSRAEPPSELAFSAVRRIAFSPASRDGSSGRKRRRRRAGCRSA
jgi:hypothetical protein